MYLNTYKKRTRQTREWGAERDVEWVQDGKETPRGVPVNDRSGRVGGGDSEERMGPSGLPEGDHCQWAGVESRDSSSNKMPPTGPRSDIRGGSQTLGNGSRPPFLVLASPLTLHDPSPPEPAPQSIRVCRSIQRGWVVDHSKQTVPYAGLPPMTLPTTGRAPPATVHHSNRTMRSLSLPRTRKDSDRKLEQDQSPRVLPQPPTPLARILNQMPCSAPSVTPKLTH